MAQINGTCLSLSLSVYLYLPLWTDHVNVSKICCCRRDVRCVCSSVRFIFFKFAASVTNFITSAIAYKQLQRHYSYVLLSLAMEFFILEMGLAIRVIKLCEAFDKSQQLELLRHPNVAHFIPGSQLSENMTIKR